MSAEKVYYVQELSPYPADMWQTLLDWGLEKANKVEFSLGSHQLPPVLQPFADLVVEQFSSRTRWQARQIGTTHFVRLSVSSALKNYLKNIPCLGGWLMDQPEDPALYVDDEKIMWTISHEELAFVLLTESEAAAFNRQGFDLHPMRQ